MKNINVNKTYNNLYIPTHHFGLRGVHTATHQVLNPEYFFCGEVHDFWEMCCVINGNLTVVEDEHIYELHPFDAVFHKPMEFHNLKVEGDTGAEVIVISFSFIGNEIYNLSNGILSFNPQHIRTLLELVTEIHGAYDFNKENLILKKSKKYNIVAERLTLLKLETFLLSLIDSSPKKDTTANDTASMHYKKIILELQNHINDRLSLDEIAALCLIGKSNLKKVFKSYTGMGVMQYFNKMKMIKAMQLLNQGYSVSETSNILGFSSPSYFSNAFKKETGVFPTEHKKHFFAYMSGAIDFTNDIL